ncbi:MAG: helix-turn-helix transcriptional regulator [Alphaproteobacteria bacterium]|nr:helix-turn-helix transcriptional regulator [Alphaproteobacteria bacterium]
MKIDIKNKLDEKGISRYELAQRIGVTYPTITSIYKGESTSVKFDILEAICKELNCSLDEILIFDDANMKEQQMERLSSYSTILNKNESDTE